MITSYKTQELSSKKLFNCVKNLEKIQNKKNNNENNFTLNCNLRNLNNIYKELYKRLIIPSYLPILVIISLILVIKSKESTNYLNFRILIFLFGLTIIIFSETSIKLISDELFKNYKIIFIPILVFLIIYSTILYKLRLKFVR